MMRVDLYLYKAGYAESRESARKSIEAGLVRVDGKAVSKPSEAVDDSVPHDVVYKRTTKYVGRGGLKLEGALKKFEIDVTGYIAADIGASTGGFTDCLLQNGAVRVYAVDSGHGQLAEKLRRDTRVVSLEGLNARELLPQHLGEACDIVVMDVSFISQTYILPRIPGILKAGGRAITLIKPQFELDKKHIGKGGIVKAPEDRYAAVLRVVRSAEECGLYLDQLAVSPIYGGDGNREYLALFSEWKNTDFIKIIEQTDFT